MRRGQVTTKTRDGLRGMFPNALAEREKMLTFRVQAQIQRLCARIGWTGSDEYPWIRLVETYRGCWHEMKHPDRPPRRGEEG